MPARTVVSSSISIVAARTTRPLFVVMALLVVVGIAASCATTAVMRPDVDKVRSVALVSLHATRAIGRGSLVVARGAGLLDDVGLAATSDRRLADDVIALESGDAQGALEALFTRVVGPHQLDEDPTLRRLVDALPGAQPDEDYTQVDGMIALDLDDERAPAALAAIARAAHVDAAIAVRHEFFVVQEAQAILPTLYVDDRAHVLLVDDDGVVLWRASAFGRAPLPAMPSSTMALQGALGLHSMITPEQWVLAARRALRAGWAAVVADNPHLAGARAPGGR